jgi:sugar phosphate isomerase/epimerase
MKISFHTDAFNSAAFSFEKCLQWAQKNDVHYIECGVIEGVSWIQGLGYFPHASLADDPLLLSRKMESYGVRFSQVDAAYPLSGKDGPYLGVPYVLKTFPWARIAGAPNIATTDGLLVNIEIHGYFTTRPEMVARMLDFVKSDFFGLNLDTGNSFIAGQDPVEFCRRFLGKIKHVHVKDVSESLAAAARGKETGIAVSQCAIGDGVNAENIKKVLGLLRDNGFGGVLSMECEGQGGPLIEKSLAWLRRTLKELGIPEER